jgi:hypothetical protein
MLLRQVMEPVRVYYVYLAGRDKAVGGSEVGREKIMSSGWMNDPATGVGHTLAGSV